MMTNVFTARLFVAVDPPVDVCEELAAWARSAVRGLGVRGEKTSSLRVLDPALLHVTLCFLGNRPVEEIAAIGGCLEECATGVGELSIGAPLWLPPRRPRALAVEVHDDAEGGLAMLHEALVQALARTCGYEEERRRYRAHVTLARMREGPRGSAREHVLPATPALSFTPASIVLYRSWLSPAGASYEALAMRTLVPS
jgi:RNA 2',3'-cyclic 3'-phosphodiesterase